MTKDRKIIVERIREEGRAAFRNGKPRFAVPKEYMGGLNKMHWEDGWNEESLVKLKELEDTKEL